MDITPPPARWPLRLQAVQIGDDALRVRGGLEVRRPVVLQNGEPRLDIAGVVGTRLNLGNDAEIGAKESGAYAATYPDSPAPI